MRIITARVAATLCFAAAIMFTALPVSATRLDIVPAFTTKFVGDVFSVDVVVSELDAAGEIVSTFDLDVSYDPAILDALSVTYGTGLGGGGVNSFQFTPVFGGGLIDFAESSVLLDTELDALQGDSVTLATLGFRAIGVGTSSLEFIPDAFFILTGRLDALDIPADLEPDVGGGRVQVDPRLVPEPSVLALFMLALMGLVFSRLRPARRALF